MNSLRNFIHKIASTTKNDDKKRQLKYVRFVGEIKVNMKWPIKDLRDKLYFKYINDFPSIETFTKQLRDDKIGEPFDRLCVQYNDRSSTRLVFTKQLPDDKIQDLYKKLQEEYKLHFVTLAALTKQLRDDYQGDMSKFKMYYDYLYTLDEVKDVMTKNAQRSKMQIVRETLAISIMLSVVMISIFIMYDPHNTAHMKLGGNEEYNECAHECMKKNSDYRIDLDEEVTPDDYQIIRDVKKKF